VACARALAGGLGVPTGDPFAALDRLSIGADAEFTHEMKQVVRWDDASGGVSADAAGVIDVARRVAGEHAPDLGNSRSLNAHTQQARRALAASFTAELAAIVARVADRMTGPRGAKPIAAAGGAFGNARFNTELSRLTGAPLSFAPVPEAAGRALGAVAAATNGFDAQLAIGPSFSEEDIKRTLDNCRLDYFYEPDWTRLLTRVSRMLAQGKVVAWFQGAMAFGPRALGTRSILSDPANRYARQNVNEYLRDLPLDEPLPVALAPSLGSSCLQSELPASPGVIDAGVRPEWRQRLAAALEWRHAVRVHGVSSSHAPRLCDLLELHYAATGSPGLIEANLAGPGEPIACTPRDAVRTVYSSAIDALVIGRFLLMKDYWLLRTGE
jgi:carbamoyltransferase